MACAYKRAGHFRRRRKTGKDSRQELHIPIMGINMPIMGVKKKSTTLRLRQRRSKTVGVRRRSPSGLANALFSMTQQRLLGLLFGQPERRFFANELIELARSGSGAVQRELHRLSDSGLVTDTKEGNRRYFQANRAAPLFEELRSIVLKTVGAAEPVRAALAAKVPQIKLAVIFGSVAKGVESVASDLDLLIVSDSLTLEETYAALAPAERQLARQVSVTLYTPEEYRRRLLDKNPFLHKVLAGEHLVLIGNVDELADAG